jgi:hypothetical protein
MVTLSLSRFDEEEEMKRMSRSERRNKTYGSTKGREAAVKMERTRVKHLG